MFKNQILFPQVHEPRARAFDALQMMRHFDEFLAEQPLHSAVFTDPDRVKIIIKKILFLKFKLLESAEIITKLSSIAQELDKNRFQTVQMRISHKYDEIEQLLIEEFIRSHDRKRMREIAVILSEFKGFSKYFVLRYVVWWLNVLVLSVDYLILIPLADFSFTLYLYIFLF